MDMQLSGGERSNKVVYVAVALAVIGLVAGIIGAVRGSSAGAQIETLTARVDSIEAKLRETADGSQNLIGQMNTFVTRSNQTLENIGRRLMSVEADVRRHEEKLAAPPPPPPTPARGTRTDTAAGPSGKVHEVKQGETLERIAKAHNISLADLMKVNPQVEPTRLKIGQKISLP